MAKKKIKAKLRTDIPFEKMNQAEKSLARQAFKNELRERDFEGEIRRAKTAQTAVKLIERTGDLRKIIESKKKRTVPLGRLPTQKAFERKEKRTKEVNPRGDILVKRKRKTSKKRV